MSEEPHDIRELRTAIEQAGIDPENNALQTLLEATPLHLLQGLWDLLDEQEIRRLFLTLDIEKKVSLISLLSSGEQERLIRTLSIQNVRQIFTAIPPDDLADIIQAIDPDVRESLWHSLSEEARAETQFLLRYDADDAAGLMTSRYLAVRSTITIRQAIAFVRTATKSVETVYYIYVVDTLKRLIGTVSLRDLLGTDDGIQVGDIMKTDVISVREETDQEEVARLLEAYDLIALPVLDEYKRMLGIITFDDVINVIRTEQTEDVYKMGAMGGSPDLYTESSIWKMIRKRIPWLAVLLLAGTITTNVISGFQTLIMAAGFLVWFVPVITQTGGNSGTQSATLMIRGLAMNEIHFHDIGRVILRELLIGLLMGTLLGVMLFLRGLFLPPGIEPVQAFAIGLALLFVVLFSSITGAVAPLVIHRLGFDPTVMAGPLMATVVDVVGITIYFQVAHIILQA